jgi:hypothetical protein
MHAKADNEISYPCDLTGEIIEDTFVDKKITEFVYLYKIWSSESYRRVNPASLAYILTKKGCNNLLDHFYTNGFRFATDWNFNIYLQSKNIFYGSKYVLATGNNSFKSDVFVDTDNYLLEDLIDTNLYYNDKNTTHSYFGIYNELLGPIRKTAKNVLEIGIGNFGQKNGGSILLWNMYFKNALIHAVDNVSSKKIHDVILWKDYNKENIKTYLNSDAYTRDFVEKIKEQGIFFDVIIDDGLHTLESQCRCIELYSELLSNNGILIIEDVQDISFIKKFKESTPEHLRDYIYVYDLRHIKNRYDDILFVINKNIKNIKNIKINDI